MSDEGRKKQLMAEKISTGIAACPKTAQTERLPLNRVRLAVAMLIVEWS